jgi:hypothetical protein
MKFINAFCPSNRFTSVEHECGGERKYDLPALNAGIVRRREGPCRELKGEQDDGEVDQRFDQDMRGERRPAKPRAERPA